MAEREGFEPPEVLPSTVFKTAAIDHSAISPKIYFFSASLLKLSGVTEIRTRDTLLAYTRFPGVPLQPLEHHSKKVAVATFAFATAKLSIISETTKFFLKKL